jgi:hypothetical protein
MQGKPSSHEKILDLLGKLAAMAKQTSSPEEAAIAAEQMQRLMFKHKISLCEIEDGDANDMAEFDVCDPTQKRPTTWQCNLATACARPNFCRVLYAPSQKLFGSTTKGSINIAGRKQDVAAVTYLYSYLLREMTRALNACRNDPLSAMVRKKVGNKAWATAFRLGFTRIIGERLREMRSVQEAEVGVACTAMVRKADAEVDAWLREKYPKLQTKPTHGQRVSAHGYEAGMAAGKEVELRRGLEGEGHNPIGKIAG